MNILCVGDLHLKNKRGYADLLEDGRKKEEASIIDFIVSQSKDCDSVIFLGDILHSRDNPSAINRDLVAFLERFGKKRLILLEGNHGRRQGEKASAIDFLKEIRGKNWQIIDKITHDEELDAVFLPYMSKEDLEAETNEAGLKALLKQLPPARFLFGHQAVSATKTSSGISTDIFNEIVLPFRELDKRYQNTFLGHIHSRTQVTTSITVVGSVMAEEMNEKEKFIFELDITPKSMTSTAVQLPGRGIYGLENPSLNDFQDIPRESIVKTVFTKKQKEEDMEAIKNFLRMHFDAHIILEQYPLERKKADISAGNILELDTEELLMLWAKSKKVDEEVLKRGWELIKIN